MKSLLVIGACYLDTILSVPYYPGEDEKLRATELLQRRGGNGPNTLEVLSQLVKHQGADVKLMLCSVLPNEASDDVKSLKNSLGNDVDLSTCIYRSQYTKAASSYIIRSSSSGSRTIVNYNALPEMTTPEFIKAINRSDHDLSWVHFEGRSPEVTLECIQAVKLSYPDSNISVEVEKPGRVGLSALAKAADVVFYSRSWAEYEGYDTPQGCLVHEAKKLRSPELLFCTWGASPAYVLDTRSTKLWTGEVTPIADNKIVDAVGAGDTFIAGVLYSLLARRPSRVADALLLGVQLASTKITKEGFQDLGKVLDNFEGLSEGSST